MGVKLLLKCDNRIGSNMDMVVNDTINLAQLVAIAVHFCASVWWASKINTKQAAHVAEIKVLFSKLEKLDERVRDAEIRLGSKG